MRGVYETVCKSGSPQKPAHSNWVTWRELIKELQKYYQDVEKPQGTAEQPMGHLPWAKAREGSG